jgi:hypothetical protein
MYCRLGPAIVSFLTVSISYAQSAQLNMRVVEGGGAINSIRLQRGHDPVVQVLDADERPATGVVVTFLLPASGPGATFGDGSLSLTTTTDARGMAIGRGLKPNRLAGQFRIRATASGKGTSANITIQQTNAEPSPKSERGKWVAIAVAVGGAVVGGAVAAAHGGEKSAAPAVAAPVQTVTGISAGAPTFGPPR